MNHWKQKRVVGWHARFGSVISRSMLGKNPAVEAAAPRQYVKHALYVIACAIDIDVYANIKQQTR